MDNHKRFFVGTNPTDELITSRLLVIRPEILASAALLKRSIKTELIRIVSAVGDTGHGVAKGAPAASLGDRNRQPGCVTYPAFP